MSFRARSMPELRSYEHALQKFNSIKPWRGDDEDDMRPLHPQRTCRRFGIGKYPNGDIYCRLWATDCVVWHPDNSITIRAWGSMSTNAFVNAIVPAGINADFCHDDHMLWVDTFERFEDGSCAAETRGYALQNTIRLKRSIHGDRFWNLHEDQERSLGTFTHAHVDRKRAKEVRAELGLDGFKTWVSAVATFERHGKNKKRKPFERIDRPHIRDSEVYNLVKQGHEGWTRLITHYKLSGDSVLMACYRFGGAIEEDERPYLVGTARWGSYNIWKARQKRYL